MKQKYLAGASKTKIQRAPVLGNLEGDTARVGGRVDLLGSLDKINRSIDQTGAIETLDRYQQEAVDMVLGGKARQAFDIEKESPKLRDLYGRGPWGHYTLMARRLVESGVRFILVTAPIQYGGMPWDHHGSLDRDIPKISRQVDKPSAGLIADLKQRGLLDETIVIWSGEFGRLPTGQRGTGRDHNRFAFTTLVAGGGFRGGYAHGATDPFGYKAVDDLVSCPDLHATLLHQLGLDHDALSFRHSGRDETLTDSPVTEAQVVTELLQGPLRV